jgi:hypothetical protein
MRGGKQIDPDASRMCKAREAAGGGENHDKDTWRRREGRRPGGGRRRWCVLVVAGGRELDFGWIRREHLGSFGRGCSDGPTDPDGRSWSVGEELS